MNDFLTQLATMSPKRLALLAVELQQKVESLERSRVEPMAVVGVGCRFPGGAVDPASFWQLLREGRSGVREVPAERWNVDAFYDADPEAPGKIVRAPRRLPRSDRSVRRRSSSASRRARRSSMDPQQRLLLEVSWEALEDAGIAPRSLVGQPDRRVRRHHDRRLRRLRARPRPARSTCTRRRGNALSVAAGRISYILGLQGPSLAVDTACSSSLVAVHLACQSLRSGECRLALAGGVNLMLSPDVNVLLSKGRMLAPDGRCKTFDAAADGYVRGEGCGVVVLKRLSDALADGDRVLAVIRGSAVNQDGRSSGLTVPNGPAQEAVMREALAQAGVEPARDRLRRGARHRHAARRSDRGAGAGATCSGKRVRPDGRCSSASVKTNIGHLEAAAGVAGLIKVVLALQHERFRRTCT